MFIDVHTAMLKASQNKNVLSCRLKAAWDDVLWIDSGSMMPLCTPDKTSDMPLHRNCIIIILNNNFLLLLLLHREIIPENIWSLLLIRVYRRLCWSLCVWLHRLSGGEFFGFVMSVPSRAVQTIVSSHCFVTYYW